VNTRFTNLGHGRRTSEFELALLAKLGATASRLTALVPSFASNTLSIEIRRTCCEKEISRMVFRMEKKDMIASSSLQLHQHETHNPDQV
jgi:hypothetical protein